MIFIEKTTDYQAIQEIAAKTWPVTYGKILSAQQIDYMFAMMYSLDALKNQAEIKNHQFVTAQENGNYVGFVSYELNYENTPKTKIHKVYILPEAQGKGIGKQLIDFIRSASKNNNQEFLLLNVNRHNNAVNFYLKTGFEKVGEENIAIGEGYLMEDFIMEQKI